MNPKRLAKGDGLEIELRVAIPKKRGRVLLVKTGSRTDEVVLRWEDWEQPLSIHRRTAADYVHLLRTLAPGQEMRLRPFGTSGNFLVVQRWTHDDGRQSVYLRDSAQVGMVHLTLEQARVHADHVEQVAAFLAEQEDREELELAP